MTVIRIRAAAAVGALAIGVLALTSACGGGGASAPAAAPQAGTGGSLADQNYSASEFTKDPCTLLTADEVTAAIGAPAAGVSGVSETGLKTCDWSRTAGAPLPDIKLHYNAAPLAQAFKTSIDKHIVGPEDGLIPVGDGAVINKGESSIQVLVGGSCFTLDGFKTKLSDDAITTLAKAAASRLP